MNLSSNQKIAVLGIILLVLAGLIVVLLKGMNVDLMLMQHKYVDVVIGNSFDKKDVENICKEVFENKKVVVKIVEEFGDTAQVNALSITDDEKSNLIQKINEKYGTELTADTITINTNPRIRILDLVRPYVLPVIIAMVCIYAYIGIMTRKEKFWFVLLNLTIVLLATQAIVISFMAITRIPVSQVTISIMFLIAMCEIVWFVSTKVNGKKA